jgi:hypothetical protein
VGRKRGVKILPVTYSERVRPGAEEQVPKIDLMTENKDPKAGATAEGQVPLPRGRCH